MQSFDTWHLLCSCSVAFVITLITSSCCSAEDRIVLRDLTILAEAPIAAFDLDGVVLTAPRKSGGILVTWDEIESLRLESLSQEQQAAAEKMLSEVGLPLYQIHYRMKVGEYVALLEPAEKVYPLYQTRRSRTAYLVSQALVWGRLAQHRREAAVEPWLHAYSLLRARVIKLNELPGERRPRIDAATALCWELEPVWFDAAAAGQALPLVVERIKTMEEPVPEGAVLYAASLALAAGERERGEKLLASQAVTQSKAQACQTILSLQAALLRKDAAASYATLRATLPKLPNECQPAALYWLGQAEFNAPEERERQAAWLTWLQIPALHADRSPMLAAEVLNRVQAASAEDRALQLRLQRELIHKFPGSSAAEKLLSAPTSATSPR
jgi:hypothetical protein